METSINLCDQANLATVVEACKAHDVGVIVKRPIANAAWKDLDDQKGFYQKYAKTYTDRLAKMDLDPQKFGLSWPELALRWTLSQAGVTTAIVGTTNPDNATANLQLAGSDPLPDDVAAAVREAFASAADASWTGQT